TDQPIVRGWTSQCRRNRRDLREAERQFRGVIGDGDLAKLAVTVERELAPPQPIPLRTMRPLSSPPDITPGPPPRSSTPAGTSSEGGRPRHATDSAGGARQRYGLAAALRGEPEAAGCARGYQPRRACPRRCPAGGVSRGRGGHGPSRRSDRPARA